MSKRYDHRVRNAIVTSGNLNLFPDLEIPISTVSDWLRKRLANVVTTHELNLPIELLVQEIQELKACLEIAKAKAKAELTTTSVSIVGFQLQFKRLPFADIKLKMIKTISNAAKFVPLSECLELVKLSPARFRA